jgi:tRNA (mo5U34)-methyltransferase
VGDSPNLPTSSQDDPLADKAYFETPLQPWPTEHDVADEVPLELDPVVARELMGSVPLWFHTFSLNRERGLYTSGEARDHGYRLASIPESFAGLDVLDVGSFDGFYSFLAERRGAGRVLAVDNEQYRNWVRSRWGVELSGGEGFRAIGDRLNSKVEYRRMDAYELSQLGETFDVIFCFGILHRVEDPIGLLSILGDRLSPGGCILVETYGVRDDVGAEAGTILVVEPEEIYPGDRHVYWQFTSCSLSRLSAAAGLGCFAMQDAPIVQGHPRIIGRIQAG